MSSAPSLLQPKSHIILKKRSKQKFSIATKLHFSNRIRNGHFDLWGWGGVNSYLPAAQSSSTANLMLPLLHSSELLHEAYSLLQEFCAFILKLPKTTGFCGVTSCQRSCPQQCEPYFPWALQLFALTTGASAHMASLCKTYYSPF